MREEETSSSRRGGLRLFVLVVQRANGESWAHFGSTWDERSGGPANKVLNPHPPAALTGTAATARSGHGRHSRGEGSARGRAGRAGEKLTPTPDRGMLGADGRPSLGPGPPWGPIASPLWGPRGKPRRFPNQGRCHLHNLPASPASGVQESGGGGAGVRRRAVEQPTKRTSQPAEGEWQ